MRYLRRLAGDSEWTKLLPIDLFDPSYILQNFLVSVTSLSKFKFGQLLSLYSHIETGVVPFANSDRMSCKLGNVINVFALKDQIADISAAPNKVLISSMEWII